MPIGMNINDFEGAKAAILVKDHVLTLLRDDDPSILYPNFWDLPGGGREDQETPLECAIRETYEETKLRFASGDVAWKRVFPNQKEGGLAHWFFVARPGWLTLPPPRLGDEGQDVCWMNIQDYLQLDDAIPHLQTRLKDYLACET